MDMRFDSICETKDSALELLRKETGCDRYDVLTAAACGAIGGIIDIFLVGAPGEGRFLEQWSDERVDDAVMRFSKLCGFNPQSEDTDDVAHAIGHLERTFKVNYDQRHGADIGLPGDMSTINHHMKSLAHSPSPIGLFFSLLNQFTSTSTFVIGGRLTTVDTELFDIGKFSFWYCSGSGELVGKTVESKLVCGSINWLGHIMSDIAGSSHIGRGPGSGTGVVIPFYELFQFCDFGSFKLGGKDSTLAELAIKVFEQGYDLRFGIALAVPVLVTDLLTRFVWICRERFQFRSEWKDCMPNSKSDRLRTMLLISNGTLCALDGADALIRSGGGVDAVQLLSRMNLFAWIRFSQLVIKEAGIRLGMERNIRIMQEMNEYLDEKLNQLKAIDLESFEKEAARAERIGKAISNAKTDEELNSVLGNIYREIGIRKPWKGDFDSHMSNRSERLVFE